MEWSQCYIEPGYLDENVTPRGYAFYLRIFSRLLDDSEAKFIAKEFLRLTGLQEHRTIYSAAHRNQLTELRFFTNRVHPKTGYFVDIGDPHLLKNWINLWLKDTGYTGRYFVKTLPFAHAEDPLAYFTAGCAWAGDE